MRMLSQIMAVAFMTIPLVVSADVSVSGSLAKWSPVTVSMDSSPLSFDERDDNPNPFLDYRYDVTFTGPSGQQFRVPGFFAGDGAGIGEGSIWKARFSPDETGVWTYRVSFRAGNNLSVNLAPYAGDPVGDDGMSGTFSVTDTPADAGDFLTYGRLAYNGSHYLKFAEGPYFIKGGVDSPENFFGFAGFDNTVDHKGGAGSAGLIAGIHRYPSHVDDWVEGDPDFSNEETGESGRAIIGAINYLSAERVNSIYFLPMNLGGDGRETFPFVGSSGSDFDNTHYDISKLYQWNLVLEHMQNKDIAAHIVLAEQEPINTAWFDDGELGVQRKLYYRELVARFGYLLAIKWNISEESRYGAERHKQFAGFLRSIDWAQQPIAVHTRRDRPEEAYDDLLGNTLFDITSIQYSPENGDNFVEQWRSQSSESGWPWVIDMDEIGAPQVGLTDTNTDELRKLVLYPVYFSGGNLEWYFGYHNLPLGGDIRTEDFRTREAMYRYMWIAREFMQDHLPFWQMTPDDSLHTLPAAMVEEAESVSETEVSPTSDVQVFYLDGEVYAVYLPTGEAVGSLSVIPGTYTLRWFNPRDGGFAGNSLLMSTDGDTDRVDITLPNPPDSMDEDWVLLIERVVSGVVEADTSGEASTPVNPEPASQPTEGPELTTDESNSESDSDAPELGAAQTSIDSAAGAPSMAVLLLLMLCRLKGIGGILRRQRRFASEKVCRS